MATESLSPEQTANIGTITSLLSTEFPGSAPVPDSRVLKALQENNNSVDLAYLELLEEQQRSSWEVSGKKSKPKQNQNNAPQSIPSSAPGRGRGGGRMAMGRGDRPEGRAQDGPQRDGGYRENRGDMRGSNMGGGRGGRGGMSGPRPPMGNRNIDSQGGMPQQAPIQPNNEVPVKQAPVPAPAAAPAPAVRQDAPPVVTNQWSQGRPRTQEEIPKPVVQEKPIVSKPAPGPVWTGSQQSKPIPAQSQSSAAPEAPKPAMPAPSAATAAAPVQPQGVSAAGAQGSISKPSQVSAAPAAAPAPASNFEGLSQMSQNLSQLGLTDSSNAMGSQQAPMHKSPQKGGMSDAAAAPGISQQDPMAAHDPYSASQFSAPNAASTQQQGGYAGQPSGGLSHFPYQQQQQTPPMAGAGQQQADLYSNDPSKLQMGGGYQLDNTFGGMGGADKGGYGAQAYNGKGGYGKGAAGGQQGGAGQMPMQQNWQQQQQQQQQQQGMGGMPNTWANPNMYGYIPPNMQNFNMAMYMQQAAGYGQYPMQMFQGGMPNAQGSGGMGGQGSGGGGGKNFGSKGKGGGGGGGGGGYNNHNNYQGGGNYGGYGAADPNSNSASGYGYNNMSNMGGGFGPGPSGYDQGMGSMGSMGFNQQTFDSTGMGHLGYNQQGQGTQGTGSTGMNSGMNTGYQGGSGYSSSMFQQEQAAPQGQWEAPGN